ncbi:S-layer homology domain-containing protein [Anoxybacillus sp. D401a]|uniref:S-layer homology domain-containing protein n=1 Tax=Anoxybacillus sp. D401a TaxID=575112 RepID=UPI003D351662
MKSKNSRKLLSASLAVSLGLTPMFVSFPSATYQVLAAENQGEFLSRLVSIYNHLDDETKEVYAVAKAQLNALSDEQWADVLGDIQTTVDQKTSPGTAIRMFKDLANILFSSGTTLEANVNHFKRTYATEFSLIFGPELTVDALLTYIGAMENEFWNHMDQGIQAALSGDVNEYYSFIRMIRQKVDQKYPSISFVSGTLKTGLGVNIEDLFMLKQRLDGHLSKELTSSQRTKLKTGLVQAVLSSGNPYETLPFLTNNDGNKVTIGQDVAVTKEQTNSKGQKEKVTEVKAEKIADIVNLVSAQNKEIALGVGTLGANEVAKAEVPAKLFGDVAVKEVKAVVHVQTDKASYKLPVAEIQAKLAEVAQKLGASVENIKIVIEMTKVNPPQGVSAVSDAVEFNIVATANNKTESITRFTQYVERELKGTKVFIPHRSVAVRVDANGKLVSVPTVFNGDQATVKSLTNSTYVVVENHKTFVDVDGGKTWAEAYIEALASKYIIKGKTDQIYAPKENMTRAQFAVLLVRALGLPGEAYDKRFKDVKGTEWFNENGELAAAVKHGIIQGKGNSLFAPNAPITRAEAAVMLKRALELSFLNYDMTQLNTSKKVTDFKDAAHIKSWATDGVEKMYQANIFTGRENERFVPNGYITRAEIAKALVKFLASAKLMNDVQ